MSTLGIGEQFAKSAGIYKNRNDLCRWSLWVYKPTKNAVRDA